MARPASNPDYGKRTLQIDPACDGLDVWELQIKLFAWGSGTDNDGIGNILEPMKVTGTFDRRTRDSVMRFQKAVGLPVNGAVDSNTFYAIDREAVLYPVLIYQLKCPCVTGANDGPILCRCTQHPNPAKCTGFGKGDYNGQYLLDGKKLGDDTDISGEKLDLYHMREYPGIDKAVIWAIRGLMRRAGVYRVKALSGYRCWADNYHHYDDLRWHHRKQTFLMGRAIEFCNDSDVGPCVETGANPNAAPCGECARVRQVALTKCGFQLRWQEPERVSVAEGSKTARPPANPFAVHVNTVRRLDAQDSDFVQTYLDSALPLAAGTVSYSFPVDLGEGTDPRVATSELFYSNVESGKGGWFPVGLSRIWHGGVHLHADKGKEVRAIADGEIVGMRVGEQEDKKTLGSRNFVLLRHEFDKKKYYSLYYHLDGEAADVLAKTRWRRLLAMRAQKHVEAVAPCPFLIVVEITLPDGVTKKKRFKPKQQDGLSPGDLTLVSGAEVDASTIDDSIPTNSKVVKLTQPADTYVFTQLEGKVLSKIVAADASIASALKKNDPAGLATPVPIRCGEVIGKIAAPATDARAATLGTFVHVEVFSDQAFLPGAGWQQIDAGDATKVPDRKAILDTLTAKNLISPPPDKVLLEEDVLLSEQDVFRELARAVVLQMPSEWSMDWKAALRTPDCLTFIQDRGALGDKFNDYRWWDDVKKKFALPAPKVFHYNPIAAIITMANA
ncbi:MAG: peptidoglycan-binding protein [Acidobacteriia bacterium]|nr:peptidoglycan-binding protein [Terriglobia bacterium]